VASLPVHNGEVGIGYLGVTLKAAGGAPPYSWAVGGGTFPPGLNLSTDGVITGKNTTSGKFPFTVKVTDAAGATATGATTIGVFSALAVSQPCSTLCWVGMNCTTCGRFGGVSGGLPPYKFKIVAGAVPSGMTLNGLTLSGAFPLPLINPFPVDVIGPPVPAKITFNLTVQVSDVFGATHNVAGKWQLFGPLTLGCQTDIQCTSCPTTQVPGDCLDTSIAYASGSPDDKIGVQVTQVCNFPGATACATTPSEIAAALPPGWSATASGGTLRVSMSCNNQCPDGSGGFTNSFYADVYFTLVDNGRCVAPANKVTVESVFNIDI
jgi:hypothetical protein